jgi:2-dehydro-3-deoxygalactonokinase
MEKFLSCDWGTSSFRLKLVDRKTTDSLAEVISDEGIAATFNAWKNSPEQNADKRIAFYRSVIKKNIAVLEQKVKCNLKGVPVFLSGMASSSVGMIEIPYTSLPFPVSGTGINTHFIGAAPDFENDMLIISGIRSGNDVIRGEETQLIGCLANMPDTNEEQVFIFPGSHSKHITIKESQVMSFKTYMTGELFNLLASHSILTESLEVPQNGRSLDTFITGVRSASNANLLHAVFSVRTNNLFNKLSKRENYLYLSGLLIGYELQELKKGKIRKLYLCCGNHLNLYYETALETLEILKDVTVIPSEKVEQSAAKGQLIIYNYIKNEQTV